MEGRIERSSAAADHIVRMRTGRERPLRSSSWAGGLWLIAATFGVLVIVLIALYAFG